MTKTLTYKRVLEDGGFGWKYATKYVCNENADLEIRIERGSISHNRPTGYTVYYKGAVANSWLASAMTLTEAKENAEYILNKLQN
jgi:hypothetical protein